MKTSIIIKDLKSSWRGKAGKNTENTTKNAENTHVLEVDIKESKQQPDQLMKQGELTSEKSSAVTISTDLESSSGVNYYSVQPHFESGKVNITGNLRKNDDKNMRQENEKSRELKTNEEESLEVMKDKISLYVSYLDSGTDSSDMEQNDTDSKSCQNNTKHEHLSNKNNKETTKKTNASKQNEKNKKQCEIEELELFEEKFQTFTTKWAVRCSRDNGEMTHNSSAPGDQQITSNCSGKQQKQTTLYQITKVNTIFTDNKELSSDSSKQLKQTNDLQLNNSTESSINQNKNIILDYATRSSLLYDEVFLLNEQSDNSECLKSKENGDQSKVDKINASPAGSQLKEKPSHHNKNDNSTLTVQRKNTFDSTENTEIKTTHRSESSPEVSSKAFYTSNSSHTENDDQNTARNDLLIKGKTKPVSEKYVNATIDSVKPGNGKNEWTPIKKTNQENTQHAPNQGKKSSSSDGDSLPGSGQKDDITKENAKRKYKENSQRPQTETKKIQRKRSRDISLENERKRSRSSSTERGDKRKESPKRYRRFSRHSEERRGTMQRDRQAARKRRNTTPDSQRNRSWFDNIVVKIADPPRPPRKKQNTNNLQRGRRGNSQERNVRGFHNAQRSTARNSDEKNQRKRRWTYDDYVRTKSGRLRRKTAVDYEKEGKTNWKR